MNYAVFILKHKILFWDKNYRKKPFIPGFYNVAGNQEENADDTSQNKYGLSAKAG